MRNEKDPHYYRGGLVYRREFGQVVITMTITTRTNTYRAWYTVGETTVEAEAEETIWLDVLAAKEDQV